jgi:hypothetical protein
MMFFHGEERSTGGRRGPFAFRMAIPEPPGTIHRGVYVDAVYF